DAELLPLKNGAFDAVFCECSFCTFPDKAASLAELYRVTRPGGWFALADVVVAEGALPEQLSGAWGRVACLADAMPLEGYVRYVEQAGFRVDVVRDCDHAALDFLKGIDSKLLLLRVGQAVGRVDTGGIDLREARALLKQAVALVQSGQVSYFYLLAQKPE
ncbi:MAG: class I SAM-dependent methyltransferase, partial [Dehalococcoidia bacterium]